jgi:hypothetical protein
MIFVPTRVLDWHTGCQAFNDQGRHDSSSYHVHNNNMSLIIHEAQAKQAVFTLYL